MNAGAFYGGELVSWNVGLERRPLQRLNPGAEYCD